MFTPGTLRSAVFAVAAGLCVPAVAVSEDDDEFMNLDMDGDGRADGRDDDPVQWTWPRQSHFDPVGQSFTIQWPGKGVDEVLPFDDIIRFERSRPYESFPDELFALVADGRRIMVSRGDDVSTHTILLTATTLLPAVELEPGKGHFPVAQTSQAPPLLLLSFTRASKAPSRRMIHGV